MNKTRIISLSFFLLSILLLFFWFNYYYETRKIEKKIFKTSENIKISKEINSILLSEFAAHTNPTYLQQLSNIYLDNNKSKEERTVVFKKTNFFNKLSNESLIIPVNSNDLVIKKIQD